MSEMSETCEMKWKIFYSDRTTFCDMDGLPEAAKGYGVLVITQDDGRVGRALVRNNDYYVYDMDRYGGWEGVDICGLLDYIMHTNAKLIIKCGTTVSNELWNEILIRASDDSYCNPKSAKRVHEPQMRPIHG